MNRSLMNKPTTLVRLHTQRPRDSIAAMDRARDQYFAKLKRAEAEYFQSVREITGAIAEEFGHVPECSEAKECPDHPNGASPPPMT